MSNPTSNFNWQMPTNSDLVTDLPADFEVFGQAVDTTMADLKGGTTGQILSKATNADMDFTWIANDQGDITAVNVTSPITGGGTSGAVTVGIQSASTSQSGAVQLSDSTSSTSTVLAATANAVKSAYDLAAAANPKSTFAAKGSIAAATAASTPANLSVGSNYAFLQADSAQSTGLAWNNTAWTSFTPVVTSAGGSITSYTASAGYTRIGKLCVMRFKVTLTNAGTASGTMFLTMPFNGIAATTQMGVARETAAVGFTASVTVEATRLEVNKYDNATPFGTGYVINGTVSYEVA